MANKERHKMIGKRYPEEFKLAAVRQVIEGGYAVTDVASRLDVTKDSLYPWIKRYGPDSAVHQAKTFEHAEINHYRP
jgi:transposase